MPCTGIRQNIIRKRINSKSIYTEKDGLHAEAGDGVHLFGYRIFYVFLHTHGVGVY